MSYLIQFNLCWVVTVCIISTFFTVGTSNAKRFKKLRYAMQRSWNGRWSSSWAKLSCSKIVLNRWIRREIRWNKDLASLLSPDWREILLLLVLLLVNVVQESFETPYVVRLHNSRTLAEAQPLFSFCHPNNNSKSSLVAAVSLTVKSCIYVCL